MRSNMGCKAGIDFSRISADVKFGKDVRLAGFVNLYGCSIGDGSFIGPFVEIQKDASVGKRVKVQSHAFICSGVEIADEVFIGHGVMFTNDLLPRATNKNGEFKTADEWVCVPTKVGKRASIGNNATILCGISIGDNAIVGAGSVVVKDVSAGTIVAGNPARILRKVGEE